MSRRPPKQPELLLGALPVESINKTIGTELEPGQVVLSRAGQAHAARRHPNEYPILLPFLNEIIADPMYIGDDRKNSGIELVGRVNGANSWALVAVTLEPDKKGRYHIASFYPVSDGKVQSRRQRGFLKVAKK